MHTDAKAHPALRLVNTPVAGTDHALPPRHARRAVAAANRRAAVASDDARWAIAAAAAAALEGGAAAVLRPERRHRLVKMAVALGLRPFDANLIIAIVQDAARTGEGPLGPSVPERLALIRPPDEPAAPVLWSMLTALAIGTMLMATIVLWILR